MLSIPLISIIHVLLNNYRGKTYVVKTFIDNLIPFKSVFVIPYLFWFLYVFIILLYFALNNGRVYFRLLSSILIGMSICFVIFYFFPTTTYRPYVIGNTWMDELVKFVYRVDNPYNCFPSIHVLNAMLVTLFFCKYNSSIFLRLCSWFICISIILSTMFIKQHYALDAFVAAFISVLLFALLDRNFITIRYPEFLRGKKLFKADKLELEEK